PTSLPSSLFRSPPPSATSTLSLHDALPICAHENLVVCGPSGTGKSHLLEALGHAAVDAGAHVSWFSLESLGALFHRHRGTRGRTDRKSTRLNSSHVSISYAVFCLKKKTQTGWMGNVRGWASRVPPNPRRVRLYTALH